MQKFTQKICKKLCFLVKKRKKVELFVQLFIFFLKNISNRLTQKTFFSYDIV